MHVSPSHIHHNIHCVFETSFALLADVSPEDSTIPSPHQQPETPPLVCDVESLNQWDISSYAKELLISVIDEYRDPLDNMVHTFLFFTIINLVSLTLYELPNVSCFF